MKKLPLLLFAVLVALSATGPLALAEPESTLGLAPSSPPPIDPSSPASGLPLIPNSVNAPEKSATAPEKTVQSAGLPNGDKTSMAEDKLRKRIQIRQAEAKAERDPELQELKVRAHLAPTLYEQRKLYTDYYVKFCDLVAKIDKTIKKEDITAMRDSYTSRYVQSHIVPTVPPETARTHHD